MEVLNRNLGNIGTLLVLAGTALGYLAGSLQGTSSIVVAAIAAGCAAAGAVLKRAVQAPGAAPGPSDQK